MNSLTWTQNSAPDFGPSFVLATAMNDESSDNNPLPPPPSQQTQKDTRVPTPVPYAIIGIERSAIIRALVHLGLDKGDVTIFIQELQDRKELCFSPFDDTSSCLQHPFLVIEGAAYSPGGLCMAHCRAARAGCYIVNHQRQTCRGAPGQLFHSRE